MEETDTTAEVVDPVCGERFPPHLATFSSAHAGGHTYFCSSTCKQLFDADPSAYPTEADE